MKKFFENKPRAWFIIGSIFVLFVTVVGLLANYFYTEKKEDVDPNILVMVGSEAITKDDLEEKYFGIELSGDIENEDLTETMELEEGQKEIFLDLLIEESLLRQFADENGVAVTDEEALTKAEEETTDWDKLTPFQQNVAINQHKNNLLREKTIEKIVTWKKGRYLEIRFDKNFALSDALPEEERKEREKTQARIIEEDRAYADELKDDLYKKLIAGTITFDEAMKTVREDKYIDYQKSDFAISDPGVEFDTLNAPEESNLLERDSYKDVLNNTKKDEISEPFLVQLDYGNWQKGEKDLKDSLWTILTVDDEFQGSTTSLNQWFADKKREVGVISYVEGYQSVEKMSYKSNEALAWNATACTSGRYNQGLSHPGDLISEVRMITASGSNVGVGGSYSYVRHADSRAYAYDGCPILGGYTIGNYGGYSASEASQSNGCMYKFSSPYASTFNLCCSGYHNAHQWKLGKSGTLEQKGKWYVRYYGTSTGSAWGGPYSGEFATGYGARHSDPDGDGVDFTIFNGKTVYLRGYWKVDPNLAPRNDYYGTGSTIKGSVKINKTTNPTTKINLGSFATDPDTLDTVNHKVAIRNITTNSNWTYLETGLVSRGSKRTLKTYNASELSPGIYYWVITTHDNHGLYNATPAGSTNSWSHHAPMYFEITQTPTTTQNCEDPNADNFGEAADCLYPSPTPELSCKVAPSSGPLVLNTTITSIHANLASNPTFSYLVSTCVNAPSTGNCTMPDGSAGLYRILTGRGETTGYPLTSAGKHYFWTRNTGYGANGWVPCGTSSATLNIGDSPEPVDVGSPLDDDGGEVSP